MTYNIKFSRLANFDLEQILSYYYEKNKSTSKKYYNGILTKIKKLKKFPYLGRSVPECIDIFYDKYRELIYENYRIIYRVYIEDIFIIRILDGRMNIDFNFLE